MLTKPQLQALHILRRQLTTATHGHFDDDAFRLLVRNLGRVREGEGGHVSSKDLDNVGFERVMAFLEERLAPYDPSVGTRWREICARHGRFITTRQEWEIHHAHEQLVAGGKDYRLGAIVRQMSGGRTEDPRELSVVEACKVIEMLHAAGARQIARA